MKITACNFARTRPNKGFYQPNQPKNHRKEREEGKREKKGLAQSLVFIVFFMIT